jgi:glyoxylase-like metal-dependent hydrolase (beta-lactamase superfamily II)
MFGANYGGIGMKNWLAALVLGLSFSAHAHNHETMNLDDLMGAFGWDFDTAGIRTEKVADGFYVLFGIGGNIGVSVGPQGVLIVDDQFPEMIPKVGDAIREVGGGAVDFAINTHWHFDHAEGNLVLGPGGTWLVSQANSRAKMLDDHVVNLVALKYMQKAYPQSALPVITYDDTMQFHFNGQQVDLMHFGPAHTTGDTAVIFRGTNAVHLGDVFNRGYPFIDADNGGDLAGMIAFCKAVLAQINADTIVIPGHGEISDYDGLKDYIAMLEDVHASLSKMAKRNKSLQEVIAAAPTKAHDAVYGDPLANFLDRAYHSVKRELGKK